MMKTIRIAAAIAAFALAALAPRPSYAVEHAVLGDWTLAGSDSTGAYNGTAKLTRNADGSTQVALNWKYASGAAGSASFQGTWSQSVLSGKITGTIGLAGGVSGAGGAKSASGSYTLSSDATRLDGVFGSAKQTLTRTLSGPAHIVILHTNDVHGQVTPLAQPDGSMKGGYPALVARLRKERDAALASGASVITLDAGDIYAGTPEGDETQGQVNVDAMNLAGFDAMAIGNHEFDQGVPVVKKIVAGLAFPALSANLKDASTGKLPAWKNLAASTMLQVEGQSVLVVGLVTSTLLSVTTTEGSQGMAVDLEATALQRELAANPSARVAIVVSHVGTPGDVTLAGQFPKVAVFVGGHTHQAITSPTRHPPASGPLCVQAGKSAQWLGRVDLTIDRASGKVQSATGKLIPIDPAEGVAQDVVAAISKDAGSITQQFDAKIATLSGPLSRTGSGSTPLGDLIADLMRQHAGADVAFFNKTGIRGSLNAGDVHLRDLYDVEPFADPDVKLTLTGAQIETIVSESLAPSIGSPPALEISGLDVKFSGSKAVAVAIGGKPIVATQSYVVATSTYLSEGGDGFVAFKQGKATSDGGVTVFQLLKTYFSGKTTVTPPPLEARWHN